MKQGINENPAHWHMLFRHVAFRQVTKKLWTKNVPSDLAGFVIACRQSRDYPLTDPRTLGPAIFQRIKNMVIGFRSVRQPYYDGEYQDKNPLSAFRVALGPLFTDKNVYPDNELSDNKCLQPGTRVDVQVRGEPGAMNIIVNRSAVVMQQCGKNGEWSQDYLVWMEEPVEFADGFHRRVDARRKQMVQYQPKVLLF